MTLPLSPQDFAAMPLEGQLSSLRAVLPSADPRALLELCAGLRDHAPLSWLGVQLARRGWLRGEAERDWFARFLVGLSGTAVDKVLRGLREEVRSGGIQTGEDLAATLVAALRVVPLARLPALCLIDRALKHAFPEVRDRHVERLVQTCTAAIEAGRVGEIELARLAQLPSSAVVALREGARTAGALEAFDALRTELARQAIAVLGDVPKAVSQANAEELLSRRVYTDPGHFLIELLQNAEDAGATTWRLTFDARRIVVWHDGLPFNTKDVVGVCSIGQTTKRKQQIGFFGVGFKSVYEVSDRPRIYSDVYRFEIADVSIPKALSTWPPDLPRDGTVLVLPLRDPDDPQRSSRALYEKACALDPVVLFTLRDVDVIELELTEAAGGPAHHAIREGVAPRTGWATIRQEPEGWSRVYAVQDDEFSYDGGWREPGKADSTRVMVGIQLDPERGVPVPLSPEDCTVYSFLPTEEHSGLRFFVQGHFDVPVDRERVTQDSAWNRWILGKVPLQLARLAERVVHVDGEAHEAARGLLDLVPMVGELTSPIFRRMTLSLPAAFRGVNVVPCTDGVLRPPPSTVVAPASIAKLFEGEAVPLHDSARHLADPELSDRVVQVVRALGGRDLDVEQLVDLLERELGPVPDGGRAGDEERAGEAPVFLREPTPARVAALHDLLLGELERLERSMERLVAARLLERLRGLPLVLGADGGWYRAGAVVRGDARMRAIYRGLRVFVHEAIDDVADERRGGLLDRLGVRRLEPRTLVQDLEAELAGRAVLERPNAAALPGSGERLGLILELLAETSHALRARARRLPLFRARDGRLHPVARDAADLGGVLSAEAGSAVAAELLGLYGTLRPLLAEEASDLVQPFAIPALGLDTLVADLGRQPPLFEEGALKRVHAVLEAVRDEIPARLRQDLLRLPIWPDRSGTPRPLEGRAAVYRAADDDVRALLPDAPFLDAEVQARAHLPQMGVEAVGGEAVLVALGPHAAPPLRIEPGPETLPAVQSYLLEHADEIKARTSRELVPGLPLFLCDRGRVSSLTELCLPASAQLRALYRVGEGSSNRETGRRFIAAEGAGLALLRRLRLEGRLEAADTTTLVSDLEAVGADLRGRDREGPLPMVGDGAGLWALLAYLAEHAHELSRTTVRRALALPIYPDRHGRLDAVSRSPHPGSTPLPPLVSCDPELRPLFELAGLRLLDAEVQQLVEPLLEVDSVEPADVGALVALLETAEPDSPLLGPPALCRVQEALLERRAALAHRYPRSGGGPSPCNPVLSGLPIWRAADGSLRPAAAVVDDAALLELMDPGTPEREALDGVRLDEEQTARLRALSPLLLPADAGLFLAGLVDRLARVGRPLSSQTPLLGRAERVARVAAALPKDAAPLWVDVRARLRRDPPRRADAETLAVLGGTEAGAALLHPELAERLSPDVLERIPLLPAKEVLSVINEGPFEELERRQSLYRWLVAHEHDLLSDAEGRELLRESRLFPSRGGRLLTPSELVFDPDLPDLGIDWQPHPEVPRGVLDLLARHLDVGRPEIEELAEEHLLPAYRRAVAEGDGERAAGLLGYLAGQLDGWDARRVQALLCPPGAPLSLEDQHGVFRPLGELLLADGEIAEQLERVVGDCPQPSPVRYGGATVKRLLARLEVPRVPSLARLRRAMEGTLSLDAGPALAALLGHLHRSGALTVEELAEGLPLRRAAWVTDGAGSLRRPGELFLWSPEVEALVGERAELYPHPEVPIHLGDELCQRLGLRTARDVRAEEVVFHIKSRAARGGLVPFRVYTWMEEGLAEGWLDAGALSRLLGQERWICTDDGEYFNHRRVVGRRALQLFGDRRGYWERGREACPTLCRVFGIPDEVTARTVARFLEELAAEVLAGGDRALLRREPALPRMLFACYARLGREEAGSVPPGLPLILSRQHGPDEAELRLLPATTRQLYRSDTPTLEALFSGAGSFHLAARGPAEEREAVDSFLERMRIRRLRDAYTVMVDEAGRDRSEERAGQLGGLLSALAALAAVLPRVRKQRAEWLDPAGWVDGERLGPLVASGRVRAIEGLRVAYRLDGVGEVHREIPAVFDPALGELLVETAVLDDPGLLGAGLAPGVSRCVYEGPGEEALTDIIEILLPLGTRERMDAYLDRRHFPEGEPAGPEADSRQRVAARLAEILDYGLDRRLQQRFPALSDRELTAWRDPALIPRVLPGDEELTLAGAAARAAPLLLDAVGVSEPGVELSEALRTLLAAPSLSEVPPGLLRPPSSSEAEMGFDAAPPLPPLPPGAGATPSTGPVSEEIRDLLSEAFRELREREGAETPPLASRPVRGLASVVQTVQPPSDAAGVPVAERRGFWDRLKGWFFSEEREPGAVSLAPLATPAWARDGGSFAPASRIGPQLWATRPALEQVASRRPAGQLYHAPPRLPVPYRYAVHLLGGTFDPGSQSWSPEGVPDLQLATGEPTGRSVELQGWLPPGPCLLPVPLYGRLHGAVRIPGDGAGRLELLGGQDSPGGRRAQVHGDEPLAVGYEVELLEVPLLTRVQVPSSVGAAPALTTPTVERRRLPAAVRRWLDRQQEQRLAHWEQSLGAQAFVQRHYRYDAAFRERPEVQRAFERLAPGRGNHHLELLHASGVDGGADLGRGICYELNAMIVELLRHLGVPALVGVGWVFDEGVVDRPDHLFALALLPTAAGPCLLPLEAALGADGPIRPLARQLSRERAVGLPPRPAVPPVPGPWNTPAATADLGGMRRAEAQRTASEEQLLRRAIRLCARVRGEPEPEGLDGVGRSSLRLLAEKALGRPELLGPLLTALRQEGSVQTTLTAPLQELTRLGLLQLRSVPSFQLWPADRG